MLYCFISIDYNHGPLSFGRRLFSTHLSVSSPSCKGKPSQSNQCHIVSVELSDVTVLYDMICRSVILNPGVSAFMSQHVSSKYRKSRQTLDRLIYSASNPSYGYNPFMKSDVLTGRQLRLLILLVNPIYLGPHVTSLS